MPFAERALLVVLGLTEGPSCSLLRANAERTLQWLVMRAVEHAPHVVGAFHLLGGETHLRFLGRTHEAFLRLSKAWISDGMSCVAGMAPSQQGRRRSRTTGAFGPRARSIYRSSSLRAADVRGRPHEPPTRMQCPGIGELSNGDRAGPVAAHYCGVPPATALARKSQSLTSLMSSSPR